MNSNCCDKKVIPETDICTGCGEHCEPTVEESTKKILNHLDGIIDCINNINGNLRGILNEYKPLIEREK